jgi:hypothetical protein
MREPRRIRILATGCGKAVIRGLLVVVFLLSGPAHGQAQSPDKDYLTRAEADQIRDAVAPSAKIHLFLTFAEDRLKKFEYELKRTTTESRREEILNGLLNDYIGCVDDATDLMDYQIQKQADMRGPSKEMQNATQGFLDRLKAIQKDGKEIDLYKDTLDDAIDGTQDAKRDADDAQTENSQPPVRRKPG